MGDLPKLEKHMEYAGLAMRSESKLMDFMSGPLQRHCDGLPGCGQASKDAMEEQEIYTLDQLCGKFMSFDRDPAAMVEWLEENGWASGWAETATHALALKLHNLLAGMASEPSKAVPEEEHMQYSELGMRSESKLVDFLSGPLQRELAVVPGCGEASIAKLEDVGIRTLDQLCGQFMLFDRDTDLMVQWMDETVGWPSGWAETTTKALAMKLHNLLD